uniref:Integrase catalytic domain-containing protein n=1 Tax=Vitrella brassicaformis TaxID=1169539 RepID=A0A7S1PCN1_9ALVE|mmetsp:Transcript_7689/g.18840  ORF Transcript_7689/g.18840 Transcript_7689/m.18840 type:complete len:108 (+) Transcript_7689:2380-2703(+)
MILPIEPSNGWVASTQIYVESPFLAFLHKKSDAPKALESFLNTVGVPRDPRQNGKAERMNRTLREMGTAMMAHANLPLAYWQYAIDTAVYLHNRRRANASASCQDQE